MPAKFQTETLPEAAIMVDCRYLVLERQSSRLSGSPSGLSPRAFSLRPLPDGNKLKADEVGIRRKQVHEARVIRGAEAAEPGIIRRRRPSSSMASATRDPSRRGD